MGESGKAASPLRRAGRLVTGHPKWSAAAAVVVLAAAGGGTYLAVSGDDAPAAAAQATTTTQTVSTGTIKQTVSASGTLAPAVDKTLDFSSSGVVTAVLVEEGQTVSKGEKLATIDSASLAADVAQAKASVADKQAKVDDDADNEDATDAQVEADQAALTAAQNQLTSAKKALAGATLTSPIDGVVASVGLTVGESVSGSGSSGSGSGDSSGPSNSSSSSSSSSGIEVISTKSWVVNATVDATAVGQIKKGLQAELTVTGATGTVYGTVSSVAVLSSSSSGTASYPVVIAVTGSPDGLHDGESVTASVIYKQLANVIVVPATALHRNSAGGQYVDKVVNGKVVQTTVQVGISSGLQTQITSGLAAGDTIQVQSFRGAGNAGTSGGRQGNGTGTGRNFPGGGGEGGGFGGATVQLPNGGSFQIPTGGFGGGRNGD